jgi:hypothetical protein
MWREVDVAAATSLHSGDHQADPWDTFRALGTATAPNLDDNTVLSLPPVMMAR